MRRISAIMATTISHVAELQGLYGPFTMAERIVQKIWLQRDFDHARAVLTDGRSLQLRNPGIWNLLGGPDFRTARFIIEGREITGDVEVHFQVADWHAHGHASDPAYDKVGLHVVLFPPADEARSALDHQGKPIPTLVLLPLLHRDLEEYTSDDALENITARDEWRHFAELAGQPLARLQSLLTAKARERWQQKVYYAGLRIGKLGWDAALHHAALEILGYRQNRSAMLAVAARHPLAEWIRGVQIAEIFAAHKTDWQLQGVRPANHPLRRLRQYQHWVATRPDWPLRALRLGDGFQADPPAGTPTREVRQLFKLRERRKNWAHELASDAISGARFDNFVCDGLFPLLTARTKNDLFAAWFHWFLGDVPDQIRRTLPKLGLADGQMQPLCHGYARGLLGWFLDCEARASS